MSEEKKTDKELAIEALEDEIMYLREDIDLYADPKDKEALRNAKAKLAELKSQ